MQPFKEDGIGSPSKTESEKGTKIRSLANDVLAKAGELREGGLRDDIEPAYEYKNAPGTVVMDTCAMARRALDLLDNKVVEPEEIAKIRSLANDVLAKAGELREGGLRDDIEPAYEYKNAPGTVVMDTCAMARRALDLLDILDNTSNQE